MRSALYPGVFPLPPPHSHGTDQQRGDERRRDRAVQRVKPHPAVHHTKVKGRAHASKDTVGEAAGDQRDSARDHVRSDDAARDAGE